MFGIQADFEYRAYDGAPGGNSVVQLPFTLLNLVFRKEDADHNILYALKLDSRSPLRSQLEPYIETVDWASLNFMGFALGDQMEAIAHQYVAALDPGLRLERVREFLMSGTIKDPRDPTGLSKIKIRIMLDGDWEVLFPRSTFDFVPNTGTPFNAGANQIEFRGNLDRVALRDFGIDIQYWNPAADNFKGDWRRLLKIDLLDGSKITGIHARVVLTPVVAPPKYELVPGTDQRYRPVHLTLEGVSLSYDHVDFDMGGDLSDALIDLLDDLARHTNAGLDFYKAIANDVVASVEKNLNALTPPDMPPLLDFPAEAVYGAAFGRPPADQVQFSYRPQIDIVAGTGKVRAIHFRHREWNRPLLPGGPGGLDPGGLLDPDVSVIDRIKDALNVNGFLADIFNIRIPVPRPDPAALSRRALDDVLERLGDRPFRARDAAALSLLKDGVPAAVLGCLRWADVDLRRETIHAATGAAPRDYRISAASVKALQGLERPRAAGHGRRGAPAATRDTAVFATPQGAPIGERGVASLWLTYKGLIDAWTKVPDLDLPDENDPPLPVTMGAPVGVALGYAVNFVVPNVQLAFLHAAQGFALAKPDFATAELATVYPPFGAGGQALTVRTATPTQAPHVDFTTGPRPLLVLQGLPVQLLVGNGGAAPLAARVDGTVGLRFRFLECPECVQGREATFLALLQNLICLAETGLIDIKGNPATLLQCLVHPHPVALAVDPPMAVSSVVVDDPGTFPPGGFPAGSTQETQLRALLEATLPFVLAQMIPVPVLFDLFHLVPQNIRTQPAPDGLAMAVAERGWMALVQKIPPETATT